MKISELTGDQLRYWYDSAYTAIQRMPALSRVACPQLGKNASGQYVAISSSGPYIKKAYDYGIPNDEYYKSHTFTGTEKERDDIYMKAIIASVYGEEVPA